MATSYATRSEADAYFLARGVEAWDQAPESARDAALIRASGYIDRKYAGRWKGARALADQDLAWPRTGVVDGDGHAIGAVIPAAVKNATYEAALAIVEGVSLEIRPGMTPAVKRERSGVGPLEEEIEYVVDSEPGSVIRFEALDGILAGLLTLKSSSGTSWLMRA